MLSGGVNQRARPQRRASLSNSRALTFGHNKNKRDVWKGRFGRMAGWVNVPFSFLVSVLSLSLLSRPLVPLKGPACSPHYGSVLLYLCRRSGKTNKDNGSSLSSTNKVGGGDNVWLKADTHRSFEGIIYFHTHSSSCHLTICRQFCFCVDVDISQGMKI